MIVKEAKELASILRGKRDALLVVGSLSDQVEIKGKKLVDLAADLALRLNLPVAATGNTITGLRAKGVTEVKKMWVMELVDFLRHASWLEPFLPRRPQTIILLGYTPEIARNVISALKDVETVVLGPAALEGATYSIPDVSLKDWGEYLEGLILALGG